MRHKRITYKDVAGHVGVSVATVSYVLNNGPRPVSAETRTRVEDAIAELGYYPNCDGAKFAVTAEFNYWVGHSQRSLSLSTVDDGSPSKGRIRIISCENALATDTP